MASMLQGTEDIHGDSSGRDDLGWWLMASSIFHVLGFWGLVFAFAAKYWYGKKVAKTVRHSAAQTVLLDQGFGVPKQERFYWSLGGDVVHQDLQCSALRHCTSIQSRRSCKLCG
jgi:hypothetical protein